jgi:uncharacterized protein (DUF362 family)
VQQIDFLGQLASLALVQGGWGYRPNQSAQVEPTCLGLLAFSLEPDGYPQILTGARQAIAQFADADGAFRSRQGRGEAVWPTALALFMQAALDFPRHEVERTANRLLELRGRVPEDPNAAEQHDIDHRLVGWPWADGNCSWVEPTAWACLALRRAGYGEHRRVEEGMRLLLDRADDEGGVNYGNRRIFGRKTEPQAEPTAIMLLALQNKELGSRVLSALSYLQNQAEKARDVEQLCWAKLALSAYAERANLSVSLDALDQRIREAHHQRVSSHWLEPAPLRLALSSLALRSAKHNVFRLPADLHHRPPPANGLHQSPDVPNTGWGARVTTAIRGLMLAGAGKLRPLSDHAEVHIGRAPDYDADLVGILARQFDAFRGAVPMRGKRVVLKPNLVEYHPDKVINTDPRVVAAVIELCRREGAGEVVVAEGPGHCRNVEFLVRESGLGDVLQSHRVPFIDLNHDEPVRLLNLGRLTGLEHLYFAKTVAAADVLISLPKLKTHHWAGATLSLKNLFGTLPGTCYGWPKNELHWRGIDQSIVDIALTRTPNLAIVDGIVGMEGDGPLNGTPRHLGALIMGTDCLAVDVTCCRLMRLNVERIGYLLLGQHKRLGRLREADIHQIGEPIKALAQAFEVLPHLATLRLGQPA